MGVRSEGHSVCGWLAPWPTGSLCTVLDQKIGKARSRAGAQEPEGSTVLAGWSRRVSVVPFEAPPALLAATDRHSQRHLQE